MIMRDSLLNSAFTVLSYIFVIFAPVSYAIEDPADLGPHAISTSEYDLGDAAFLPTGYPEPVELRASVHHPRNLSQGPFPLIVLLHGKHATCFEGSDASVEWPCLDGRQAIPSFTGYNYLAETLASHGYIVVSISANGINAFDGMVDDLGMLARAELIQQHLKLWAEFNSTGGTPFGNQFVHKVDLTNIGTMGHSRGGEGVVRHFLLNKEQGSPFGVRAIFPLAPTDFNRFVANEVSMGTMLPYCDGDVADLQGVHFYDDARYNVPGDLAWKHAMLVLGANHNFFNTTWTPSEFAAGSVDDWLTISGPDREDPDDPSNDGSDIPSDDPHCGNVAGNGRLTAAQQRNVGLAYITAFFRTYLGDESQFLSLLTGDSPAPPSAGTDGIFLSYHAPDSPQLRRDVNRLLSSKNLETNTLGGVVSQNALLFYDLCGGNSSEAHCLFFSDEDGADSNQPHTTPSFLAPDKPGLSQLRLSWNSIQASYLNHLPAGNRDVSSFTSFVLRASINFSEDANPQDAPQDFSVVLVDGNGAAESVMVNDFSQALFYPPGNSSDIGFNPVVPKIFLNTVQVPLSAFSVVDLTDIHSVALNFDVKESGALLVSDMAFTNSLICDANHPDAIIGTKSSKALLGTPGDDIIIGTQGDDLIIGRGGNDCIDSGLGNDRIFTSNGADKIIAGAGNDLIISRGGHDVIDAGDGNDVVNAGYGDDFVRGGAGNDRLLGGRGKDTIKAGIGRDKILAGAGNDRVDGGPGKDTVIGGSGKDTCADSEKIIGCQQK